MAHTTVPPPAQRQTSPGLHRQLVAIVGIGALLFAGSFPVASSELLRDMVFGTLRFVLLAALLVLLSRKAIKAWLDRGQTAQPELAATGADDGMAEEKSARLLRLLTHPLTIGVFLAILLTVRAYAIHVMSCDEGIWNYIAHAWLKFGMRPYIDTLENKTPGIFYLFRISNLLFGVNYWFPRLLGVLTVVLSALGVYAIGNRLQGRAVGALAMMLFGLSCASRVLDPPLTSQTEIFMIGFSVLAAYLIITLRTAPSRWSHLLALFLAGCSLGAAIAFKQVAVFTVLGLFILYLSLRKPWAQTTAAVVRDSLLVLSGLVLITVISVIPLLLCKVPLASYLHGAWLSLLAPGSSESSLRGRLMMGLYTMESPDLQLYLPMLLLILLLHKRIKAAGIPFAGLLGWYICDLLAANSSGTYYGHQLRQGLVPLVLLSAFALQALIRGRFTLEPLRRSHYLLVGLALFFIWWNVPGRYESNDSADAIKWTGQYLRAQTTPQDNIYIIGTLDVNPILAYSERRASSRHFNQFFFAAPGVEAEIQHDLQSRPPLYLVLPKKKEVGLQPILDGEKFPTWITTLADRDYHLVQEFTFVAHGKFNDGQILGFQIYRRGGASSRKYSSPSGESLDANGRSPLR